MTDYRTALKHDLGRVGPAPFTFDDVTRRRDRKRRNQRIAAGIVGIAVFVAAVWIVTSVGSLDRSETSVVPGGDVTGPLETGQVETGPTGWSGRGLPPEDAVPSTPVEGEIVTELVGGIGPQELLGWVYADGRVIWTGPGGDLNMLNERRLTPEGVELVRSGSIAPEDAGPPWISYPASAWADSQIAPYVPPRYAICYAVPSVLLHAWTGKDEFHIVDPSSVEGLLPGRAESLLRGNERTYEHVTLDPSVVDSVPTATCFEVTTEEARTLEEILSNAGFGRPSSFDGVSFFGPVGGFSFMPPDKGDEAIAIWFVPLLPHGEWAAVCRCG